MPSVRQIVTMSFVPAAVLDHVRKTLHYQTVELSAWKDVLAMRGTF